MSGCFLCGDSDGRVSFWYRYVDFFMDHMQVWSVKLHAEHPAEEVDGVFDAFVFEYHFPWWSADSLHDERVSFDHRSDDLIDRELCMDSVPVLFVEELKQAVPSEEMFVAPYAKRNAAVRSLPTSPVFWIQVVTAQMYRSVQNLRYFFFEIFLFLNIIFVVDDEERVFHMSPSSFVHKSRFFVKEKR